VDPPVPTTVDPPRVSNKVDVMKKLSILDKEVNTMSAELNWTRDAVTWIGESLEHLFLEHGFIPPIPFPERKEADKEKQAQSGSSGSEESEPTTPMKKQKFFEEGECSKSQKDEGLIIVLDD